MTGNVNSNNSVHWVDGNTNDVQTNDFTRSSSDCVVRHCKHIRSRSVPCEKNTFTGLKVHYKCFVCNNVSYLLKSSTMSQMYDINYVVWMQDNVFQNVPTWVWQVLLQTFGDELIFRQCVSNVYGLTWSLDLTIIDFWLCCYLNSKVYTSKAWEFRQLKQVIKRVMQNLLL